MDDGLVGHVRPPGRAMIVRAMGLMEVTRLLQEKLFLELPPVGMAFVDEPPEGVLVMGKEPPSFCSLWRWGERSVFYASAEQHLGCLVGGMVAGVPLAEPQVDEVKQLMEEMCHAEDLPPDDPAQVPVIRGRKWTGIVYGPLWRFPVKAGDKPPRYEGGVEPDLALMWVTIVQAGVLQDVAGRVLWRGNAEGANFARPACSVLAIALDRDKPALSLGCVGMWTYTQLPRELCLLAVPGSQLPLLEEALQGIEDPEARMQGYVDKLKAAGMM